MLGIRDRQLGLLVGLMFAPFALQLLGWAGTPLGGGPCGAIGLDQLMLEQPQAFFYAQIMLWGISLLMATGFFVLMLGFMHNGTIQKSQARPFLLIALAVGSLTALIYVLTHTVGLPAPSPVGWLLGGAEPTDAIGILIFLVLLVQISLALRWLVQTEPAPPKAAPSQAHRSRVI
ncbi:hypothetical protein [Meiothermus hypogaeus]|uniref:Uncharacterized protein n=2 Tax=Meiothermus hypogaeus TaxID=884155 RepID=A0A511QZM6_9DEIN|nr:hypothetical protein [Meiothermus hypogaeus]RIH81007.1 hypothetical protein Mhypo_00045 [Meiothermus hypogaeus]GEM82497.1 hypothetical protein MHY01S_06630 [Meiothermus hypogaeus NBRC 106114]